MLHILADLVEVYVALLVARALMSWVPVRSGSPWLSVQRFLATVTEPVLRPIRRMLPPVRAGGASLDLSFIIVILVAELIVIPILR